MNKLIKFKNLLFNRCVLIMCSLICFVHFSAQASCTSPAAIPGQTHWDSTNKDLLYCANTEWKSFSYGGFSEATDYNILSGRDASAFYSSALKGNVLYMLNASHEMVVYDLSDPASPEVLSKVSHTNFNFYTSKIVVNDNYAYLLYLNKLTIINISNPAAPVIASHFNLTSSFSDSSRVSISGSNLYYSSSANIVEINVSNPSAPSITRLITIPSGAVIDFKIRGSRLYTIKNSLFEIYDITSNPPVLINSRSDTNLNGAKGVVVLEDRAILISDKNPNNGGFITYLDISDELDLIVLDTFEEGVVGPLEGIDDYSWFGNQIAFVRENLRENHFVTIVDFSNDKIQFVSQKMFDGQRACDKVSLGASIVACFMKNSFEYKYFSLSQNPIMRDRSSSLLNFEGFRDTSLSVSGNKLVTLNRGNSSLKVFDITNKANPNLVMNSFLPSPARGESIPSRNILYDGSYLYLLRAYNLEVYNLTGSELVLLSRIYLGSLSGVELAKKGSVIFLRGQNTLQSVDVSNPLNPVKLLEMNATSSGKIHIEGDFLYSVSSGALDIYDISNPSLITLETSFTKIDSYPISTFYKDNNIYVFSSNRFEVIDVTNPSLPAMISSFQLNVNSAGPSSGVLHKNYIFMDVTTSNKKMIDILNPSSITNSNILSSGSVIPYQHTCIDVVTGIYCVNSTNSNSLDYYYSDIANPLYVSRTLVDSRFMEAVSVIKNGHFLYSLKSTLLDVLNIQDSLNPLHQASINLGGGTAKEMHQYGDELFIVVGNVLKIFNVTSPANPIELSSFTDSRLNASIGFVVSSNYLYSLGSSVVTIFDISNRSIPSYVGQLTDPSMSNCKKINSKNSALYLLCANKLIVLDISNPTNLQKVQEFPLDFEGGNITHEKSIIVNNYLYVGCYEALCVFDITDSLNPVYKGLALGERKIEDLYYIDGFLYSASDKLIEVFDTYNPLNPKLHYRIPHFKSGKYFLVKQGDNIILIANNPGIYEVYPLDDLINVDSAEFSYLNLAETTSVIDVFKYQNYALVTHRNIGVISLFDISNELAPVFVKFLVNPLFYRIKDLVFKNQYAYATINDYGSTPLVIDFSDILNPKVTQLDRSKRRYYDKVLTYQDTLLITRDQYVEFYNITNPLRPVYIGEASVNTSRVALYGNDLITFFDEVRFYNLSALPVLSQRKAIPLNYSGNYPSLFKVEGDKLYHYHTNGFSIIDLISESLLFSSQLFTPSIYSSSTDVANDVLYVQPQNSYLFKAFDLRDPDNIYEAAVSPRMLSSNYFSKVIGASFYAFSNFTSEFKVFKYEKPVVLGSCTKESELTFDEVSKSFVYCDGVKKKGVSLANTSVGVMCSSPSASIGTIQYFADDSRYKFCDGQNWVMAGNP